MASGDVFPKRLGGPTQVSVSGTPTTLFTVPTGRQYTIKQIIICNTGGTDRTITVGIGGVTAALASVFLLPIGGYDVTVLDTGLVLEAGETLQGCSDLAATVTVTVTGWDRQI